MHLMKGPMASSDCPMPWPKPGAQVSQSQQDLWVAQGSAAFYMAVPAVSCCSGPGAHGLHDSAKWLDQTAKANHTFLTTEKPSASSICPLFMTSICAFFNYAFQRGRKKALLYCVGPEKLWCILPWRSPETAWTCSWAPCSGCPLLKQGLDKMDLEVYSHLNHSVKVLA